MRIAGDSRNPIKSTLDFDKIERWAWLNYHLLLYFWTVAREGGVAAASRRWRLSQSVLDGRIARDR